MKNWQLTETAGNQVNGVVVGKVHGRPPQPHGVEDIDWEQPGEDVSHEQSLQGSPSRVQRGEGTEDHWGAKEGGGVDVDAGKLVNSLETCSVAVNAVVCGSQSVRVFVPWRRAWENNLDEDGCDVHVSKSTSPDRKGSWRTPDEHACANNDGRYVVDDTVGQPGKDIEDGVLVGRKDVAQV